MPITEWKTSSYETHRIVFTSKSTVYFPGHDFNNGSKPLVVVADSGEVLVIKFPGGKHWAGNYQPWASHPAEFGVYGKLSDTTEGDRREVIAVKLVEFPVRTPIAKARTESK
mgnify:CR=1 FL=1